MLLHLYASQTSSKSLNLDAGPAENSADAHARSKRDAEEFELEGLMSDDDALEPEANISRTKKVGK